MNTRNLLVSVLMLVSVLLSACAPAAKPAPTAIPPTIAPTTASVQGQPTFSSKIFKLPMTLSYGPDWSVTEYPNQVYLQKLSIDSWQLAFNLVAGATIADPNSAGEIPWPQDLVGYLKSNPYIEAGEPKPVMVGGFKGIQIDAHAKYTGDKRPFITIAGSAEGWLYLDYEEMWRFIVLDDMNGERLVITMTASPAPYKGPTTPVTEFSMFADESLKVLDTVVFSKDATIASASTLTTFSPKTFDMPSTFSYGPDWKIDSEFSSQVVQLKYKDYDGEFLFINPKSATVAGPAAPYSVIPFPDDFVNWIQAHGLFRVVKTQSVFVGGLSGTQIDATSACGSHTAWLFVGAGGWNCDPGGHYRFTYLDDVNGERLLIMTVGYVSAQDFMLMTDASQKVLDTVVFSQPTAAQGLTTFSPKTFNLPITLSHSPEWSIAEEYSDVFTLSYIGHDAGVSFINVKNAKYADGIAFPNDFVTWIQSSDSLFQVEDSKPVLVGGFKGTQINAIGTCGEKKMWIILSGTGWWCPSRGHMGFIYLDNVNGERVLIEIQGSPGDKDYEFIVEESQKVLDTVVFSKP